MSKLLGQESLLAIKSWSEGKFAEKATTLAGYGITDAYTKTQADTAIASAISTAVSSALKYKGTVQTYSALPANPSEGDVYNIEQADSTHGIKAGDNVAWTGAAWDVLAGAIDLSGYVTTSALSTTLADYVTNSSLSTTLASYLTTASAASTYVAKETGKSLVSDTEIAKLSGVTAGAEPNVIDGITVDGAAVTVTNKIAAITLPAQDFYTQAETLAILNGSN